MAETTCLQDNPEYWASRNNSKLTLGSTLTTAEWDAIDKPDTLHAARESTSFKTLQAIISNETENYLKDPPRLLKTDPVGEFIASLPDGKAWDAFLADYFQMSPAKIEELHKPKTPFTVDQLAVKLRGTTKVGDLSKAESANIAFTVAWAQALQSRTGADALVLRQAAARAGDANGFEVAAGNIHWKLLSEVQQAQAIEFEFSSFNKPSSFFGKPTPYPHQKLVINKIGNHLVKLEKALKGNTSYPPLHLIFSTPTGSGKTFSVLLLHFLLLAKPGVVDVKFRKKILVYAVPARSVLQRVATDCEANRLVYWAAAFVSDGNFEVRRPYSIRTGGIETSAKTEKGRIKYGPATGPLKDMLISISKQSVDFKDRGAGKPAVIIGDVVAIAELLKLSHEVELDDPVFGQFHHSNLVLFFDEPNMGTEIVKKSFESARKIIKHLPDTAILASATLPKWDSLESWWKQTPSATLDIVTQEKPYGLPLCELSLLHVRTRVESDAKLVAMSHHAVHEENQHDDIDSDHETNDRTALTDQAAKTESSAEDALDDQFGGFKRTTSIFDLFADFAHYHRFLTANPRHVPLLARHVTAKQALVLCNLSPSTVKWENLYVDPATAREEKLAPALVGLTEQQFSRFQDQFRSAASKAKTLRDAVAKGGITLVACLNPDQVARSLLGLTASEYVRARAQIRSRIKAAQKDQDQFEKELRSAAKKKAKNNDDDEGLREGETRERKTDIKLGKLIVSLDDANAMSDDTLLLLSRGIAASYQGADQMLLDQFQRAVLSVPESILDRAANTRPALHILVVDYNSIYGMDCPAVSNVILCDDLGELLSKGDILQCVGRLRRDGAAVFTAAKTMLKGIFEDDGVDEDLARKLSNFTISNDAESDASDSDAEGDSVADSAPGADIPSLQNAVNAVAQDCSSSKSGAVEKINAIVSQYGDITTLGQTVGLILSRTLEVEMQPLATGGDLKQLRKSALDALEKWGPTVQKLVKSKLEQVELIKSVALYLETSPLLKSASLVFQSLFNEIVSEDAMTQWRDRASPESATVKNLTGFFEWMDASEDEDEDEE